MTVLDLLKKHFGYDQFRPLQAEIIASVLERRDTLVLMPTGGGKSLCYQLPALRFDGLTLVISPLIALMKDQVDTLKANGIAAEFINSSLTYPELNSVRTRVRRNAVKILYVAPERLALSGFQESPGRAEGQPRRRGRGALHLHVGARVPTRLPQLGRSAPSPAGRPVHRP